MIPEVRNRIGGWLRNSVAHRAAMLLPARPRRKLALLVLVQLFLGALDLIAVALVGLLGTLAVAGVQSQEVGVDGNIGRVLQLLQIDDLSITSQVAVLGLVTGVLFVGRTLASIYLTRRALHFLGGRAAEASADLVDRILQQPLTYLQTRSTQDFIYSTTYSTNALILGVLGSIVIMAADASMLMVLGLLMLYVSPVVAIASATLLGTFVLLLHRFTTSRAQTLGEDAARFDVESRDLLAEAIATFRDMQVRGSRGYYSRASREVRNRAATVNAEWAFLPNVSKYVLEATVVVGALLISALQFALEDAQRAVGILTLFLAAGMRLAPAVIRLQQGATMLRYSAGQGTHSLSLQKELPVGPGIFESAQEFVCSHMGFSPQIELESLTYTYPGASTPAISNFSVRIDAGSLIALVGPSGSGKSTIADLLLGVLEPDSGQVVISGLSPKKAVIEWPGAIGYVPQEVWIADGSVRKNVCLGLDPTRVPDDAVWSALESARLAETIRAFPEGLDTHVGERGSRLSGGQRQRLGIARALLMQPRLLLLDEATSALDANTEHEVTDAIKGLHGRVTVIVVAHRLATVRQADLVVYIEQGRIRASGTFTSVRLEVPDFDRQARLLGLS